MESGDHFVDDVNLGLEDFTKVYGFPQTVKITEGIYTADVEFSTGDILVLTGLECEGATVVLEDNSKVFLPRTYEGTFKVLPSISLDHVYTTVTDLVEKCPFLAKVNTSFGSPGSDGSVTAGEKIRLIRVVKRGEHDFLECKRLKEAKLAWLPMDGVGNFNELDIDRFYTIGELISIMPRQRRLRFSDSHAIMRNPLPGNHEGYEGVLTMERPSCVLLAHPQSNPGLSYRLSVTTPISVSPREDLYECLTKEHYELNSFIQQNRSLLPIVCRIMDWERPTNALALQMLFPGEEIIVHREKTVEKILAKYKDEKYSIPLNSYNGFFVLHKKVIKGVGNVEHIRPQGHLRVIKGSKSDIMELDSIEEGDILKLVDNDWCIRHAKPGGSNNRDEEIEVLVMIKCDSETLRPIKLVRLPLYFDAEFEEVIVGPLSKEFQLKGISLDYPVEVVQTTRDPEFGDRNPLPVGKVIQLIGPYQENNILASKIEIGVTTSEAFHLPVLTQVSLAYVDRVRSGAVSTRRVISKNDACPEVLTAKEADMIDPSAYELVEAAPITPIINQRPKKPDRRPGMIGRRPPPPIPIEEPPPRPRKPVSLRGKLLEDGAGYLMPNKGDERKRSLSDSVVITKSHVMTYDDYISDEEDDYVPVHDYEPPPGESVQIPTGHVKIPADGNLYDFSADDMALFFVQMNIDEKFVHFGLLLKLDGRKFSKLTPDDMNRLGLIDNQVLQHFRKNTKRRIMSKFFKNII